MKKLMKNRKGFTLIELIVVIAILGILAAILIPQFGGFQEKARQKAVLAEARTLATAIDAYKAETSNYPDSKTDLEGFVNKASVPGDMSEIGAMGGFTYTSITEKDNSGNFIIAGRSSAGSKLLCPFTGSIS